MEGEALSWFKWRVKRQAFSGWGEFQNEILRRFSMDQDWTPYEELLSLRQTDIVREFRRRFELLSVAVEGMTEETLTTLFMNGLADDIQTEVRMFAPVTLEMIMERAKQVEEKNWVIDTKLGLRPETRVTCPSPKAFFSSPNFSYFPSSSPNTSTHSNIQTSQPRFQPTQSTNRPTNSIQPTTYSNSTRSSQNNQTQSTIPRNASSASSTDIRSNKGARSSTASINQPPREKTYRRLSDEEFRMKMERGLCFRCNDRYYPGHHVKFGRLG